MPIPLQCNCGRRLNLADNLCGKRIKCPECAAILTVPTAQVSSSTKNKVAKVQPTKKPPEDNSAKPKPKPIIISGRSASAELEQTTPPSRSPVQRPEPVQPPEEKPAAGRTASAKRTAPKPAPAKQTPAAPKPPAAAPPQRSPSRDLEEYDEELFADVPISGGIFAGNQSPGQRHQRRGNSRLWLMIGGGAAVLVIVLMVVFGLFSVLGGDPPVSAFVADSPDTLAAAQPLTPPPQPALAQTVGNGVLTGSTSYQNGIIPGGSTQLQVYMPPGQHAPRSLGCVLVAPAGTNLLVGSMLDDPDYHDEALPYAEAGYVTIKYSIDGGVPDLETATDSEMAAAYEQFRKARYGVINTQRAIDFALTYPEIDPQRIYVAGHSSAGTLALLAAEHEPRIQGCIAYAPCSDVDSFHSDLHSNLALRFLLPDLIFVSHDSSPLTYAERLKCPLFLFHAQDDSVVGIAVTQKFAQQVRTHNSNVELYEVPFGEHYDSMIQQGIPRALTWMLQRKM